MIHCLAGAHRAGTTGCACLMYYANLDVENSISKAIKLRPVIDPIGNFPDFLKKLRKALDTVEFMYDPERRPFLNMEAITFPSYD